MASVGAIASDEGVARGAGGRVGIHSRRSRFAAVALGPALEVRGRALLQFERAPMTDIKPEDIEALLEEFRRLDLAGSASQGRRLEIFVSKTPGARGPGLTGPRHEAEAPPFRRRARWPQPHRRARRRPWRVAPAQSPRNPRRLHIGSLYAHQILAPLPRTQARGGALRLGGTEGGCRHRGLSLEVMKLFTNVLAGVAGTVQQILVEDTELVEYDQPLFLIEPA